MTKNLKISILTFAMLSTAVLAHAQAMSSPTYRLQSDSLNFAGARSTSGSYTAEDTAGESGTGPSGSSQYALNAGYQQSNSQAATPATTTPGTNPYQNPNSTPSGTTPWQMLISSTSTPPGGPAVQNPSDNGSWMNQDPFANIPESPIHDPRIDRLVLADFEFIQNNSLHGVRGGRVNIDGTKNLTVRLEYNKVPELLKTIGMSLTDPEDPTRIFPFVLRANSQKTYYEATIGPLGRSGTYKLAVVVLDYENRSMKRLDGALEASVLSALQNAAPGFNFLYLLILALVVLLILALLAHKRKKKAMSASALVIAALFALSSFYIYASTAHAAINKEINYQGKLMDTANATVPDSLFNMRFALYTSPSGGVPVWTETRIGADRVTVTSGLFSIMLGSVNTLDGVDFDQSLYLGVEVGGPGIVPNWDGEMSPRKPIGTVPAAFVAENAHALNGLSSGQFLRSDAQNATSSASTFLNVLQSGAGKIAEFFGSASQAVLSILSNGNVGIGSSTPAYALSVEGSSSLGNTAIAGAFIATTSTASQLPYASTTALSAATICLTGDTCRQTWPASGASFGYLFPSNATSTLLSFSGGLTSLASSTIGDGTQSGGLTISGGATTTGNQYISGNLRVNSLNGSLQAVNGLVSATNTLSIAYGGTGTSTAPSYGKLLVGNSLGAYDYIATSSLGLLSSVAWGQIIGTLSDQSDLQTALNAKFNAANFGSSFYSFFSATNTDALAQGSTNKYYSDSLVNSFIHASTTIPKTYTNNIFTGSNTFGGSNTFNGASAFNAGLTANSFTLGTLNGPLQANNGVVSATSSVGVLYGGTGLTSAPSYGNLLVGNALGGYTLTSTSSLGIVTNPGGANRQIQFNNSGAFGASSDFAFDSLGRLNVGAVSPTARAHIYGSDPVPGTGTISGYDFNGNVTGSGTSWLTELHPGDVIYDAGVGASSTVETVLADDAITVYPPFSRLDTVDSLSDSFTYQQPIIRADNTFGGVATSQFNIDALGNEHLRGNIMSSTGGPSLDANNRTLRAPNGDAMLDWGTDGSNTMNLFGGNIILFNSGFDVEMWDSTLWVRQINAAGGQAIDVFGHQLIGPDHSTPVLNFNHLTNIGVGTSSPWGKLSVQGNSGDGSQPLFVVASTTPSGSKTTQFIVTNTGNVGIGTTSPWRTFSVNGSSDLGTNALAGNFTATTSTASTFPYASSTAITVSGTASTTNLISSILATTNALTANSFTLGTLNGPLQANNGVVSATSSIGVLYGGTGLTSAPTSGQILVGNSSGGYTLTSTTSLGFASSTGLIAVVHSDGTRTIYNATTSSDVGRGTALLTAFGAAVNGDSVHLAPATFDLQSRGIDLSLGNTGSVSLYGSGKYATVIKSANAYIVLTASNSETADLSLVASNMATYTWAWGNYLANAPTASTTLRNVYINSSSDGIFTSTQPLFAKIVNVDVDTEYDSLAWNSIGGVLDIYDSRFTSVASSVMNSGLVAHGANIPFGTGSVNFYNTILSASGASSENYAILAGSTVTMNGGALSSSGVNAYDFHRYGFDGTLRITANTIYNPAKATAGLSFIDNPQIAASLGSTGTNGYILQSTGTTTKWVATSTLDWECGSNGQLIFNSSNACGASSGLTYDGTTLTVDSGTSFRGGSLNGYRPIIVSGNLADEVGLETDQDGVIAIYNTLNDSYSYGGNSLGINGGTGLTTVNQGLAIGSLNGILQGINGAVSASSTLSVAYGGTGISTLPSYGNILVGNALGGYTLTSTSTLNITGIVNQGNTLYVDAVNGNDSTGLRGRQDRPFLTPLAAKAAASAGDEIRVSPGTYTMTSGSPNLAKNGVNWYFAASSTVVYTGTSLTGIFDDSSNGANAPTSFNVYGQGVFRFIAPPGISSGDRGVINITNASSNVSIQADSIEQLGQSNAYIGTIHHTAGTLTVNARVILQRGTYYNIWWEDGDSHITANTIRGGGPTIEVKPPTSATPTGYLWVNADHIDDTDRDGIDYGTVLRAEGSNPSSRVWINAQEITGGLYVNNDKVYVQTSKITTNSQNTSVIWTEGGFLWLKAEKVTAELHPSEIGPSGWAYLNGGENYFDVQHWEDKGVDTTNSDAYTGAGITVNSGTTTISSDIIKAETAGMSAVSITGGVLNLKDAIISSPSDASDLIRVGGTLNLAGVTYDTTKTQGTLTHIDANAVVKSIQHATINVGIGTTSPWRALSVVGSSDLGTNALAGYFTATTSTASQFPYASSTAITVSGTASTSALIASNSFTLAKLTGILQGINGAVSASSTLSVAYGGTGLSTLPSYGNILVGNALGGYTLTSTSTLGLPTFAYPFLSNATSTLLSFTGGLTSYASTTIGNGTQAGGLTISGGATTTGNLNVLGATSTILNAFNVGSSTPSSPFTVNTGGIGSVSSSNVVLDTSTGDYFSGDGAYGVYMIYAYKTIGSTKYFSKHGLLTKAVADTGAGPGLAYDVSWTPVPGATGYRVFINNPSLAAYLTNLGGPAPFCDFNGCDVYTYYDTTSTSFVDGDEAAYSTYVSTSVDPIGTQNSVDLFTNKTTGALTNAGDITTFGNLGIGTSTPQYPLSIFNPYTNTGLDITSNTSPSTAANGGKGSITIRSLDGIARLRMYHINGSGVVDAEGSTTNAFSVLGQFNSSNGASTNSTLVMGGLGFYTGVNKNWGRAILQTKSQTLDNMYQNIVADGHGTTLIAANSSSDTALAGLAIASTTVIGSTWATTQNCILSSLCVEGSVGVGTTSPWRKLSVTGSSDLGTNALAGYFTATTSTASSFPYASTTALSAVSICLTGDTCRTTWPTSGGSSFAYPFLSNATTTLLSFNGGLRSFASSTIGNGTQAGGLTISGGATTTGNTYFSGATNTFTGTVRMGTDAEHVDYSVVDDFCAPNGCGPIPYILPFSTNAGGNFALTGGGLFLQTTASTISQLDFLSQDASQSAVFTFDEPTGKLKLSTNGLSVGNGQAPLSTLDVTGGAAFGSYGTSVAAPTNGIIVSGNVGIGSSTPWRKLSVTGSSDLGTNALAGYFTATTSTASSFPYASTTALSAVSICLTGDTCRTTWPTSGGSSFSYPFPSNATTTSLALNGGITTTSTIGVGTTTPGGLVSIAALSTNASPLFLISTSTASATTTAFVINPNGKVGIGTTSPFAQLSVTGNIASNAIIPNGTYTNNLSPYDLGATGSRWNALWAGTVNIGTSTWSLKNGTNNRLGIFDAASGGGNERMSFLTNGNVGIGTTTPIGKLEVDLSNNDYTNTNGAGSAIVINNPLPSGGQNVVTSMINGVVEGKWRTDDQGNLSWVAYNGAQDFYTGGDYGVGTNRMHLGNDGSVSLTGSSITLNGPVNTTYNTLDDGGGNATVSGFFEANAGIDSSDGDICSSAYGACISQLSDARLKKNVAPLGSALDKLMQLNPVSYNWNDVYLKMHPDLAGATSTKVGFIAQDMQKVFPEIVTQAKNGYFEVDYPKFTAVLTQAIKEVNGKVDAQASSRPAPQVAAPAVNVSIDQVTFLAHSVDDLNSKVNGISSSTALLGNTVASLSSSSTLADVIASKIIYDFSSTSVSTTTPFIQTIVSAVKDAISSAGEWVVAKITAASGSFAELFTQKITVGTSEKPNGITLFDQATGSPYCFEIRNGQSVTEPGECQAAAAASIPPVVSNATTTAPSSVASSTASTEPGTVASSSVASVVVSPSSSATSTVTSTEASAASAPTAPPTEVVATPPPPPTDPAVEPAPATPAAAAPVDPQASSGDTTSS